MKLMLFCLLWAVPAWAGDVTLMMSDAQLRGAITEVCLWHSCESPQNGGYKSDQEKLVWVMNRLIQIVSMGHYKGLEAIDATIHLEYDRPEGITIP